MARDVSAKRKPAAGATRRKRADALPQAKRDEVLRLVRSGYMPPAALAKAGVTGAQAKAAGAKFAEALSEAEAVGTAYLQARATERALAGDNGLLKAVLESRRANGGALEAVLTRATEGELRAAVGRLSEEARRRLAAAVGGVAHEDALEELGRDDRVGRMTPEERAQRLLAVLHDARAHLAPLEHRVIGAAAQRLARERDMLSAKQRAAIDRELAEDILAHVWRPLVREMGDPVGEARERLRELLREALVSRVPEGATLATGPVPSPRSASNFPTNGRSAVSRESRDSGVAEAVREYIPDNLDLSPGASMKREVLRQEAEAMEREARLTPEEHRARFAELFKRPRVSWADR